MRLQDSTEYRIVKEITSEENRKNIIDAAKAFAFLLAAMLGMIWAFASFLLWIKDIDVSMAIIDFMIWIKEIIS
jgi:hypothetical protein